MFKNWVQLLVSDDLQREIKIIATREKDRGEYFSELILPNDRQSESISLTYMKNLVSDTYRVLFLSQRCIVYNKTWLGWISSFPRIASTSRRIKEESPSFESLVWADARTDGV